MMPNRETTLLFLIKNDSILLAMKKRGFGAGKWNGVGGKVEPTETVAEAAIRECQEEICVTALDIEKVAHHTFLWEDGSGFECHAFICRNWQGEPTETEEMAPRWFKHHEIPYNQMWEDDQHWLPLVVAGQKIVCDFTFDETNQIKSKEIRHMPTEYQPRTCR